MRRKRIQELLTHNADPQIITGSVTMDANLQVEIKIKQTHILLDYYLENVMFEIKKFYIEHLYFIQTECSYCYWN